MPTTEPFIPAGSGPPTLHDHDAEVLPLIDTVVVAGPPVLLMWAGTVLFALMLAGPFALVATLVVVLVAAAALVTLAGAILATPYLLVRHVRLRLAEPQRDPASRRDDLPIASVLRCARRAPAAGVSRLSARCLGGPRRHLTWGARAKRPSRLPLRLSVAAASVPMPKAPSTVRSTPY
jgi:hypothetical protein